MVLFKNRRQQIEAVQAKIQEAADELEGLIAELQTAFDNTPEGLQASERGAAMEARIDTLQEWHDQLTEMTEAEV